jgi:hypothetical protein
MGGFDMSEMNIFVVRDNLKNTIAGKEAMLKGIAKDTTYGKIIEQMLEYNIDELKRILQDVEVCCASGLVCSGV